MEFEANYLGIFAFGLIIGWYVYYVNRYRKGDVQFSDITTLIGVIGGGLAVKGVYLDKFPDAFGWYGIGLAVGFFGYFFVLVGLVKKSVNFDADWFLDGRRKNPASDFGYGSDAASTVRSMNERIGSGVVSSGSVSPGSVSTQNFYIGAAQSLATTPNKIQAACIRLLPANAGDCSAFARAVCAELGVTLSGQANDIVAQLTAANGWTVIGSDSTAGKRAAEAAGKNLLVVGAKINHPNGHVVIVVPGQPERDKYPHAYWGKLNEPENAGYDKTVNWAWNSADRDSVTYASRAV
jgi:hypothetical protein